MLLFIIYFISKYNIHECFESDDSNAEKESLLCWTREKPKPSTQPLHESLVSSWAAFQRSFRFRRCPDTRTTRKKGRWQCFLVRHWPCFEAKSHWSICVFVDWVWPDIFSTLWPSPFWAGAQHGKNDSRPFKRKE